MTVRLAFRSPLWPHSLFGHLAATAVPGVEEWRDGAYRRTLRLAHGPGLVALSPRAKHVRCELALHDMRDVAQAIGVCRRLLDLDADPEAVDETLGRDRTLGPLVKRSRGRRVPGTVDADELAIRIVLGQQVSTAAARTLTGRIVAAAGTPVDDPDGGLTHLFPGPGAIAELDPAILTMPGTRRRSVLTLASQLADGTIDLGLGADGEFAKQQLAALPGVGPWTVATIAMRAFGDPDVFLATDLGVRTAARSLGLPSSPAALAEHALRWRPWRSYAVQYLWGAGDHPINRMPDEPDGE